MTRLALATFHNTYGDEFDPLQTDSTLFDALIKRDVKPSWHIWNDDGVDWSQFDTVLIRSTWDYYLHYPQFMAWLAHLDALGVPVINPTRLIRWNADKRYLRDLHESGVSIIPTHFLDNEGAHRDTIDLAGIMRENGWQQAVVKPAVSASAHETHRVHMADALEFVPTLHHLLATSPLLIQPYMAQIEQGEWSLMFFGDEYSHCVLKRPQAGSFYVQVEHGGHNELAQPHASVIEQAHDIVRQAAAIVGEPIAYARVDGVRDADGRLALMELELIEPELFIAMQPGSGQHLADAIVASIRRTPPRASSHASSHASANPSHEDA